MGINRTSRHTQCVRSVKRNAIKNAFILGAAEGVLLEFGEQRAARVCRRLRAILDELIRNPQATAELADAVENAFG